MSSTRPTSSTSPRAQHDGRRRTRFGTIIDNDAPPTLGVSDAVISVPATGTAPPTSSSRSRDLGQADHSQVRDRQRHRHLLRLRPEEPHHPDVHPRDDHQDTGDIKADKSTNLTRLSSSTFRTGERVPARHPGSDHHPVDNDPTPAMSINDPSITEGNSGTKNLTFTITLTNPSDSTITVDYATVNGTAVAPVTTAPRRASSPSHRDRRRAPSILDQGRHRRRTRRDLPRQPDQPSQRHHQPAEADKEPSRTTTSRGHPPQRAH